MRYFILRFTFSLFYLFTLTTLVLRLKAPKMGTETSIFIGLLGGIWTTEDKLLHPKSRSYPMVTICSCSQSYMTLMSCPTCSSILRPPYALHETNWLNHPATNNVLYAAALCACHPGAETTFLVLDIPLSI